VKALAFGTKPGEDRDQVGEAQLGIAVDAVGPWAKDALLGGSADDQGVEERADQQSW